MSEEEKMETPSEGEKEENGGETPEAEWVVTWSDEDIAQLEADLEAAREEAKANHDGMLRAQADYQNLRRRTAIERDQMKVEAIGSVITPFLDILDDLELAVKNKPAEINDNGWSEGIVLVYRKLLNRLESQGISRIEALGQPFDPHFHEAIMQEESDEYESGHVMDVVKPGYLAGERVLRPAMVRVAA